MVGSLPHAESIFGVLGGQARSRALHSLTVQLVLGVVTGIVVQRVAPHWWSVSVLLFAAACYAGWGLLARGIGRGPLPPARWALNLSRLVAAAATVLVATGIIGLALALFTGHGRSPYDPCGVGATSRYCQGLKAPVPVPRIP
jgi:hypothetical protein